MKKKREQREKREKREKGESQKASAKRGRERARRRNGEKSKTCSSFFFSFSHLQGLRQLDAVKRREVLVGEVEGRR